MGDKKEKKIDDIFMYKFKNNMLLTMLILGISMLIWGIVIRQDMSTLNRKILAQEFFINKLNKQDKEATKINKDVKFGKIDILKVDDLLLLLNIFKAELKKDSKLQTFKISNLDWTKNKIRYVNLDVKAEFDSYTKLFKYLNRYKNLNVLSKKFNISYDKGKWIMSATLQIYYKGKLSPDIIKEFKIEEPKNNDSKTDIKNKNNTNKINPKTTGDK